MLIYRTGHRSRFLLWTAALLLAVVGSIWLFMQRSRQQANTHSQGSLHNEDSLGNVGYAPLEPETISRAAASNRVAELERSASQSSAPKYPTNITALLQTLQDRTADVANRAAAADSLGKLRAKEAVAPLLQVLRDNSESVTLKYKSARALGLLNDDKAVSVLTSLLDSQSTDRHLRVVSALALGNLGTKAAFQALARAEQDPDSLIRFKAVQALEGTRDAVGQEIVTKALNDPDIFVQARAIQTLGKVSDGSTVTTIIRILQSTGSDFIRVACLNALGDVNRPEALPILHEYKNNTNQILSQNAKSALQKLNSTERNRQ